MITSKEHVVLALIFFAIHRIQGQNFGQTYLQNADNVNVLKPPTSRLLKTLLTLASSKGILSDVVSNLPPETIGAIIEEQELAAAVALNPSQYVGYSVQQPQQICDINTLPIPFSTTSEIPLSSPQSLPSTLPATGILQNPIIQETQLPRPLISAQLFDDYTPINVEFAQTFPINLDDSQPVNQLIPALTVPLNVGCDDTPNPINLHFNIQMPELPNIAVITGEYSGNPSSVPIVQPTSCEPIFDSGFQAGPSPCIIVKRLKISIAKFTTFIFNIVIYQWWFWWMLLTNQFLVYRQR